MARENVATSPKWRDAFDYLLTQYHRTFDPMDQTAQPEIAANHVTKFLEFVRLRVQQDPVFAGVAGGQLRTLSVEVEGHVLPLLDADRLVENGNTVDIGGIPINAYGPSSMGSTVRSPTLPIN